MRVGVSFLKSCRLLTRSKLLDNRLPTCFNQEMYRDERRRGRGYRGPGNWDQRRYYQDDNIMEDTDRPRYEAFNKSRGGRRGGGRGRQKYSNRDEDWNDRHDRPPPGLKGREIGMWHARRSKARAEQKEKNMRSEIKMVHHQERNIRQLLHEVKSSRECPPQPTRSGAELPVEIEEDAGMDSFVDSEKNDVTGNCGVKVDEGASCSSNQEPDVIDVDELPEITEMMEFLNEDDYIDKYDDDYEAKADQELNTKLLEQFKKTKENLIYKNLKKIRDKLPIYKEREVILDAIHKNQVVVLSGETGCGKTTQIPQYILDDFIEQERGSECSVICTQPRRISAITVAERVAEERAEACGYDNSVGYMIRLQHKLPRQAGSILYCTTGILLKMLEGDPLLERASHVILDEIHERDLFSDFLLIIMKDLVQKRPDLKLILMSATLKAEDFSRYFNDCLMIHAKGFTYPVKEYLLEDVIELLRYKVPDYMLKTSRRKKRGRNQKSDFEEEEIMREAWLRNLDERYSRSTRDALADMDMTKIDLKLIKDLIWHIVTSKPDGAILVFVPGMSDIKDLHDMMTKDSSFKSAGCNVIGLHSMLPTMREVFETSPKGIRKIVVATNIAETSITIDDVVYVIDCGQTKITGFMPENDLATLQNVLVSRANSKQRRGRAGRVQPGECYHLYTSLQESLMVDQHPPEILRTRLEELCLLVKCLNLGKVLPFVQKAMQPPSFEAIESAIVKLQDLNALDKEENLLPLGRHLAQIPLDPHTGKMILFGAIFGCLNPILTVAACLSFKEPFVTPLGKEKLADMARIRMSDNSFSDHILLVNAMRRWKRARNRGTEQSLCWDNFMSNSTLVSLDKMRNQLAGLLCDLGFIKSKDPSHYQANQNSDNTALVKAIVCAGLYPNVGKIKSLPTKFRPMRFVLKDGSKCELHPKSVVKDVGKSPGSQWVVFHKKMKTTSVFVYDCTIVSPYSLLFFGGDIKHIYEDNVETVCVDDWIRFKASSDMVTLVKELRHELDYVLDTLIRGNNRSDLDPNSKKGAIIKAIIEIVTTEAAESNFENDQRY